MNLSLQWLGAAAIGLALSGGANAQQGQMYTLGPFDRVVVSGTASVELTQGDRDQAFVVGDDSQQRGVKLTVFDGRLQIKTEDGWKFWSSDTVQVKVQLRQVTQLRISGAGDITAPKAIKAGDLDVQISGQGVVKLADVTASRLKFTISGSGGGELAGNVTELQMRISGKGKLQAERLKANKAEVTISGIGQTDVWAMEDLRIGISGVGTVNYWGKPKVERSVSGVSEINARGER